VKTGAAGKILCHWEPHHGLAANPLSALSEKPPLVCSESSVRSPLSLKPKANMGVFSDRIKHRLRTATLPCRELRSSGR
jgi:hypothetical protein